MFPFFYTLIEANYQFTKSCSDYFQNYFNNYEKHINFPGKQVFTDYIKTYFGSYELVTKKYDKPSWNITEIDTEDKKITIKQTIVKKGDYADLILFSRFGENDLKLESKEKILLIAPMSGHFATLLRDTVQRILVDYDVYVTDWHDAKNVPLEKGDFTLDSYIGVLIDYIETIDENNKPNKTEKQKKRSENTKPNKNNVNAIAVCQPGPALLVAAAFMAMENNPSIPKSIVLMGSPIDTRLSPTIINKFASKYPLEWFNENMITNVPDKYKGKERKVYPGFLQVLSFLNMNPEKHINAHFEFVKNVMCKKVEETKNHKDFYEEYFAICDIHAPFYLQTLNDIFQNHLIPKNKFIYNNKTVDFDALSNIGLITIEGEKDDITGKGQTRAAHDICKNIPKDLKLEFLQKDVGHFGLFSGSQWRDDIYLKIKDFIEKL